MSYTTTQLADAVLRELSVADASETPDTADHTYVTDTYDALWEELAGHGMELVYWPASEIPNPIFLIIRDLLTLECRGAFGQPIDPADKEQRRVVILRRLRRHVQTQESGKSVKATYY